MERRLKVGHEEDEEGDCYVNCVKSTETYVITGGEDGKAVVWERGGAGKIVRTLEGHRGPVGCLDTTPCEKYVVTGSWGLYSYSVETIEREQRAILRRTYSRGSRCRGDSEWGWDRQRK